MVSEGLGEGDDVSGKSIQKLGFLPFCSGGRCWSVWADELKLCQAAGFPQGQWQTFSKDAFSQLNCW